MDGVEGCELNIHLKLFLKRISKLLKVLFLTFELLWRKLKSLEYGWKRKAT